MATAFTQNVESSNLLRFPLSFRSYFLIRLAYGSLDPATAVASLWLLGINIGIGVARPALFPWAMIVLLTFALVNLVLARMLFAWLERWLAQRRTRELMGILFFLFILSFQLIGPLIAVYEHRSIPETRILGQELSSAQRPLPPGLAAAAIAGAVPSQPGSHIVTASVVPFLLLGCYGIAFLWLLNFRLRAEYRGENLSESVGRKALIGGLPAARPGWNLPGLPGPVVAVFEKELRYLSRSGPMLFTLIVPLFMLAVFRSSGKNEGLFAHAPQLTFPLGAAYSLLLLTNLSYNNFGADGNGTQFFFASPVRFGQIMLGKNLAHMAVLALAICVVWIGASLLFRPPSRAIAIATVAGVLFAAPVNLAVGNWLSLYSPKRIEFGTFGRQRASQLTVLISFGVQIIVFGLGAATMGLARYYRETWLATGVFLVLAVVGFTGYSMVLKRVDRMALARRERLTTELCR